ncbi:TerB family tellurite resistance protein [Thermomonas sp.]|uniref:TerB family tellurite resistance protein n=1 Tax=Thermomonas sp. TaxID=1971895 RepID=UPI001D54CEE4|nr:TerB family tellurite resistance protein [Thermomonas sp.]MBZ0087758.1 TerB family tellurite resistance protein [Thermomonas sp.]MCO5054260.1 TerB family tellurite resistance protein [Thermomonas sp.]HRO63979.1 TerB family tellurite resistance protein [Thermomonas sp.]
MAENDKHSGMRGVFNDIRLLLSDMLGLGKPDAERRMTIEVFFGMMGYVAKTDRLVSSHESNVANTVMDEIDLSLAEREIASSAFDRGMSRNINAQAELLRFTDSHKPGSEQIDRLFDILVRLAASDSRLDVREHDALKEIAKSLGLPATAVDNKLALYTIKR